jgi:hypothetical protein
MQTEKGQPAFENIDDILAEKIVDHTRTSADTNAQETEIVEKKSGSKRMFPRLSKTAVLILLSIPVIVFLLIKTKRNRK